MLLLMNIAEMLLLMNISEILLLMNIAVNAAPHEYS
jgi:hypothetical protein